MKKFILPLIAVVSLMSISLPAFAGESFAASVSAPEPVTLALLAGGIGAVVLLRKSRDKK